MNRFSLRLPALLTVSLLSLGLLNPSFNDRFFKSDGTKATKKVYKAQQNEVGFEMTTLAPIEDNGNARPRSSFRPLKTEKWTGTNATSINLLGAKLDFPAGAMTAPAVVSITALQNVEIPALDYGMVNVTAGSEGYRFLPHGSHFAKPVALAISYDETKIPPGHTAHDIATFFFDEKANHWVPLQRDSVDIASKEILSETMHFTDMINAVLEVPETPATLAYTPNTMSGITMPDAASKIAMIDAPTANNSGSAVLSYPIKLPAGRNGMEPDLAVQYNSDGGNNWMGLGWDLTAPAVSIETRWGVPRYNATLETETYTIDGGQVAPVAHRSDPISRTVEKQFYPRVNSEFQKIIRHGSNPKNYWWEVTEKNGDRRFFGGDTRNGVDAAAVLTDASGNIGYWALTEGRDLSENFVRYRYTKVMDAGTAGGNPGANLYLSSITYTGNGNTEGKYRVVFTRDRDLSESKRQDVTISARLGFKQVTADLLRKVEVKYNGVNIRSYQLNYTNGAFYKTLLQNIKEFDAAGVLFTTHAFDYYNDIQGAGGVYQPLAAPKEWNPQNDNVKGTFLNPIPGFQDNASALSGNKSIGGGFGLAVTIGPDDEELASKSNTAGIAFGFNISTNEGMLALVDINGDGLVDKVFKDKEDKKLYYRANLSAVDSNGAFGPRLPINGVNDFNQGLNWGVNVGLESNFGVYAGLGYAHAENITNVYLADVNGDGLVDIVNNGTVFFNHLDANGNPTFTASSGDTPSPIKASPGVKIDPSLVQNDSAALQKAIDDNPLHDVVKIWVAPFDGTVNITAPVALFQDPASQSYTAADGVRVAIQHKGTELWSTKIAANDFTSKTPSGVGAVAVKKGDRIYFRTQSVFNGAYDQVHWTPKISYSTHVPGLNDANGQPIYKFQSDSDFLMSAPLSVSMPIDGKIHIRGDFVKRVTSDSIVVTILKEKNKVFTTLLEEHLNWNQAVTVPVSIDQKVLKGENLYFRVSSESNIDWTSIHWDPNLYYTASDDPKVPQVLNAKSEPLIKISPTVDFQAYTKTVIPSLPWTAPSKDTFSIEATPTLNLNSLNLDPLNLNPLNGQIFFSVKRENELIAKETITVTNGKIGAHPALTAILNSGDRVFFEYHTADTLVAAALKGDSVVVRPKHSNADTLTGGFHTLDNSFIFGPMYRHWGQFAYNGNRLRADQPLIETELQLNKAFTTKPEPIDLSPLVDTSNISGSMNNMQQSYDGKGGYQPKDDKFIYLAPDNQRQAWIGYDNFTFVTRDTISSSRMGRDDILPVNPVVVSNPGSGSGAVGIKKVAQTDDFNLGVSVGEVGAGVSTGTTKFVYDFTDMNGDGYPDILSNSKIQYTNSYGGLEPNAKPFDFGDVTFSNHTSVGGTAGGKLELSSSPNASATGGGAKSEDAEAKSEASAGISVNFSANFDKETVAFMDLNGDGLADRVHSDGMVELNLGYSFLPAEQWGYSGLSDGTSLNYGGGISINFDAYSIAAGISLTRTENVTNKTLLDVNGDGLLDYIQEVNPLIVRLNTGSGFGPAITWTGASAVNNGISTGESVNVAFTIGISLIPILPVVKLCINPQVTVSQGADRTQVQFEDIDGDGFPDYLQSDVDSKLTVSRSTIKRTNRLKKVSRPMGGSFVLDYKRVGNTYDMPNNVWALSSVNLYDGVPGDGPEYTNNTFEYQNGRYNRNEREFYGFGKLVVKNNNTENNNVVYRTTEQEYLNDNFYNKGLLKSEVLKDANGNKFTETRNTYELKDIITGATLSDVLAKSDDGTAFPALVTTEKLFYEGQANAGKTSRTTFLYDLLGNITGSTDFGDPGPDDDVSTTITYHAVPAKYIMNVPSAVTVTGGAQVYRQKASTINNTTGKVTELRQLLQSGGIATSNMTYDATGNLTSLTRPLNAAGQRLAYTYQYDGDVQTYVTKTTDSYGYSSSATYDVRFGQMLSATDLNGQQTQYTIDNAGRVLTIREPLELAAGKPFTIAYEYHPEAVVPWALAKHFDPANPTNFLETASFKDGLGREVQTKKDIALFSGAKAADQEVMVVSGSTTFDAFFRPIVQYYPITEPKGSTLGIYNAGADTVKPFLMTYDVLDRVLVTTLPDQVTQIKKYGFGNDRNGTVQFKTTSTDANGISTESFVNVRELLKATKQQYSQGSDVWTSYDYNPVNELVKATDDQNNVISMSYDQLGRKSSDVHPDAGTTNYKYDLAGNLVEKTTANLQSGAGIKYTYDQERLVKIIYPKNPQNNVTIMYGAAGETFFRAGRISKQQDGSGTQQFFYNPLGAVVKNIRVINVPDTLPLTYTTEWTYDTWNRLTAMVYPDGEKLTYNYNVGGSLRNMAGIFNGTNYNYLTQLGYDKFEERVFMQYGNGTEMTNTFGAQRRELAKMTAKTSAGRFMMDNTLSWDNENEILGIVNAAPVPPSNLMGGKSDYQFTYDDLYRVTSAGGSFTGSTSQNRFTLDMTYNTVSGILAKKQVHTKKGIDDIDWSPRNGTTYSYDYNYKPGSKPHAPVHIGTEAFTYDANGNQTGKQDDVSAQNRQMEWDEENRIKTLSDNGYLTRYTYDAAGTRVLKSVGNGQTVSINGKQVATTSGTGNYTIYVNPYQVVQSGSYTKHIYIEGQRIVSKLGSSGKSANNKDAFQFYYHPDHLGNSAFITDAKGEVYQHLEYFPFGETFVAEQGNQQRTPYLYNGKELDDETGLYYYGARYYNPITSIWQNVDPSWGLPNQIGTSPYAYVQNNPITFIDPDGRYKKAFDELTPEEQMKVIKTLFEEKKNKISSATASAQTNNPNATQPLATSGDGSSMNSSATASKANNGKSAGKKYHVTVNLLGINVYSTFKDKRTAAQKQAANEEKKLKAQQNFAEKLQKVKEDNLLHPRVLSVFLKIAKLRGLTK